MRTPIERLAFELAGEPSTLDVTIGQLARKYDETTERIMDALDVLKIIHGLSTTIPPVPWPTTHPGADRRPPEQLSDEPCHHGIGMDSPQSEDASDVHRLELP